MLLFQIWWRKTSKLTLLARQPFDPYGNIGHTAGPSRRIYRLALALALRSPDVRGSNPGRQSFFKLSFFHFSKLINYSWGAYIYPSRGQSVKEETPAPDDDDGVSVPVSHTKLPHYNLPLSLPCCVHWIVQEWKPKWWTITKECINWWLRSELILILPFGRDLTRYAWGGPWCCKGLS